MKIREIKNAIGFAVKELNKNSSLTRNLLITTMALGFIAALLGAFQSAGLFAHIGFLNTLPGWVGPVVGGGGMLSSIAGFMGLGALLIKGVKHYYDLKKYNDDKEKTIHYSDSEDDETNPYAQIGSSSESEDEDRPNRLPRPRNRSINTGSELLVNPKVEDFRTIMMLTSPEYNSDIEQ